MEKIGIVKELWVREVLYRIRFNIRCFLRVVLVRGGCVSCFCRWSECIRVFLEI